MSSGSLNIEQAHQQGEKKVETNNLVNTLISYPGYTNPNNMHTTTLIDSSYNVTLLDDLSPSNTPDI